MYSYLTQPNINPTYRIIHAVHLLMCALNDASAVRTEAQHQDISDLHDVFAKCQSGDVTPNMAKTPPSVLIPDVAPPRVPNVAPPRVLAIQHQPTPMKPPAPPAPAPTRVLFSEDNSSATKTLIRVSPGGNLQRSHPPGWFHQPIAHHTLSSSQPQTPPPH